MRQTRLSAVSRCVRVYGSLLRAYPQAFRERYADEMVQVFRDAAQDAWRRTGRVGLAILCLRVLLDTVLNSIHERSGADQFGIIWARGFALFVDRLGVLFVLAILGFYIAPLGSLFESSPLALDGSIDWRVGSDHLIPKMTFVFVYGLPSIPWATALALWVVGSIRRLNATPGMRWVGLTVSTHDGRSLRGRHLLLWHLASYVSGLCLGLGYLWAFIDPEARTWHDIIAGVRVLRASQESQPAL